MNQIIIFLDDFGEERKRALPALSIHTPVFIDFNAAISAFWVISSGKMVISRKVICFEPLQDDIFDSSKREYII